MSSRICPECLTALPSSTKRDFCSHTCQNQAWRREEMCDPTYIKAGVGCDHVPYGKRLHDGFRILQEDQG
jgi:hypothetical protein